MLYYRHTNNNSENANDSDVRGYGCVICFLSFLVFHASSVSYSIIDGGRNTREDTPRNLTVFCRPVQPWGFCHWLAVAEHVLHVLRWGQGVHFRGQAGWSISHKDHHTEQAVQAQLHRRSPQERVGCFNIWVYCVAGVIFGSTGQALCLNTWFYGIISVILGSTGQALCLSTWFYGIVGVIFGSIGQAWCLSTWFYCVLLERCSLWHVLIWEWWWCSFCVCE